MDGDHTVMTLNLTQDQQEAYKKFLGFLLSDEKEFHLFGAAGCGKTFLIQHFITQGLKDYRKTIQVLGVKSKIKASYVTATTNKAAALLQSKFCQVQTIFKLFNVSVSENYKTGETYLKENDTPMLKNNLIFIDECSMLPKQMLKIIRANTFNCKIVYVGDNYQLAPVNERPMWDQTPTATTAILSTPVRNKESQALVDLCAQLRETVDTKIFKPIKLVPGAIEKLDNDGLANWLNTANFETSRALSFTNKRALEYIHWVEQNRYARSDFLAEGQTYINNSLIQSNQGHCLYYPEEELKLLKMEPEVLTQYRHKDNRFYSYDFHTRKVDLISNQTGKQKTVQICTRPNEFKAVLKQVAKDKDWLSYYDLKDRIGDLRLPYASTVHKSQGSTFDEVVVDLESFEQCKSYSVASRLLYVAVSRARKKVYFYGDMPERFGSLVE